MKSVRLIVLGAVIGALSLAGCGGSGSSSSSAAGTATNGSGTGSTTSAAASSASANQLSYEGIPLQSGPEIAPASTTGTSTVDGIKCGSKEQLVYHIHAHLAVFKDGVAYSLPAGVGIPGSSTVQTTEGPVASGGDCIYWLHTHAPDGVIHVESPTFRVYSLGQFFDEWHQPLDAHHIGNLTGKVQALFDGRLWTKNVRLIPLLPHALIQLDIGQPAPPVITVNWTGTHL